MVRENERERVNHREVSQRLKQAMKRRRVGVRRLHELLTEHLKETEARPPAGTSYGAVRAYVEGETRKPRVSVLRMLAEVLRVRPDWLLWDDGEIDEEAERFRRAASRKLPDPEESPEDFMDIRITSVFPEYQFLDADGHALVWSAIARFYAAVPDERRDAAGTVDPDDLNVFLMILRQAALSPLVSFATGNNEPVNFDDPRVQDYVRSVLSALILSIPKKITGRPRNCYIEVTEGGPQYMYRPLFTDEKEDTNG